MEDVGVTKASKYVQFSYRRILLHRLLRASHVKHFGSILQNHTERGEVNSEAVRERAANGILSGVVIQRVLHRVEVLLAGRRVGCAEVVDDVALHVPSQYPYHLQQQTMNDYLR